MHNSHLEELEKELVIQYEFFKHKLKFIDKSFVDHAQKIRMTNDAWKSTLGIVLDEIEKINEE